MGGRGSLGGTRSTYRGDSTALFRQRQQQGGGDGNGGGGGGSSSNNNGNASTDTGGIQNGGGGNGDGGSVVQEATTDVNKTAAPSDDELERLFQVSPEYLAFDKKYENASEAVYNQKYAEELAKWIGLQTPSAPKPTPSTPAAPKPWYEKLKKNVNFSNETLEDLKAKAEGINRQYREDAANRINCQRATAAFEMQCRNYDVAAQPITEGWLPRVYNPNTDSYDNNSASFKQIAGMWSDPVTGKKGEWVTPQTTDWNELIDEMEEEILSWGEGARGFVGVSWNNSSAHIFNVVVKDGRAVYVDAQPTEMGYNLTFVDVEFDRNDWKDNIDPTLWQGVMRVDNLQPAPRVGTWVRERSEIEINVPQAEEVWPEILRRQDLPEDDLNAIPDDFDLQMAFFYGWQAAWMGKTRPEDGDLKKIAPKPIRNDEVMMQVFEMGLDWSEVPI